MQKCKLWLVKQLKLCVHQYKSIKNVMHSGKNTVRLVDSRGTKYTEHPSYTLKQKTPQNKQIEKKKKPSVFVKHECPRRQQSQKFAILRTKVTIKVTRSLTLVSFDKVSLVEYGYQIINLYLLRFKGYGQG